MGLFEETYNLENFPNIPPNVEIPQAFLWREGYYGKRRPRKQLNAPAGDAVTESYYPFQVILRAEGADDPEDPPVFYWKIYGISNLYKSLKFDDLLTITGLDFDVEVTGETKIWLEIEFDTDGITPIGATIEHDEEWWEDYPAFGTYSGTDPNKKLVKSYRPLGEIRQDPSSDNYYLFDSFVFSHLILRNTCNNPYLVWPVPF